MAERKQTTLQEVTPAELTAARLRRMAKDLILEAEALEASIPRRNNSSSGDVFVDPTTGKRERISKVDL